MATTEIHAALDPMALRARFPILDQEVHGKRLVYLDNAATSQKPLQVLDAISAYYRHDNANVHRGIHELSRRATDAYEDARSRTAHFINAPDTSELIWTKGTSEAINLIAQAWGRETLQPGDVVVLSKMEHHSNLIPWQLLARQTGAKLRFFDVDAEGELALDDLELLVDEAVKVVSIGHVSNALGTINPVRLIADRAHDVGALMVVDGAQGAPHLPVDVQALGCDFYAFSGHKMFGPTGIGALWGRRDLLEAMEPYQGGGEMISVVDLESSTWAAVPHKFEAGTPNIAGAVGMGAAVDFILELGHDAILAHERDVVGYCVERLTEAGGVKIFGPSDLSRRSGVVSFEVEGVHPHDVATVLDSEGVAIRAGHHCAQPLMKHLKVPATNRASFSVFNGRDDVDQLIHGLAAVKRLFA